MVPSFVPVDTLQDASGSTKRLVRWDLLMCVNHQVPERTEAQASSLDQEAEEGQEGSSQRREARACEDAPAEYDHCP